MDITNKSKKGRQLELDNLFEEKYWIHILKNCFCMFTLYQTTFTRSWETGAEMSTLCVMLLLCKHIARDFILLRYTCWSCRSSWIHCETFVGKACVNVDEAGNTNFQSRKGSTDMVHSNATRAIKPFKLLVNQTTCMTKKWQSY